VTKIVLPTMDLMFKKLFSCIEHKNVIQGFLNEVLGLDVDADDIVIKNPYSIKSFEEDVKRIEEAEGEGDIEKVTKLRQTIRDVTLSVIDLADVTIEMQLAKPKDFLTRMHYYLDETYTGNYNRNISEGQTRYSSLKPVISLNVLDFDFFEGDRALRSFTYRDDETGAALESEIREGFASEHNLAGRPLKQIGFFELKKHAVKDKDVANWRDFIKSGIPNPGASQAIQEAAKIVQYNNLAMEEREVIDTVERAIATSHAVYLGMKEQAHAEGHAKGRAEGFEGGLQKVALNLFRRNRPLSEVREDTNLPIEVLANLYKQVQQERQGAVAA